MEAGLGSRPEAGIYQEGDDLSRKDTGGPGPGQSQQGWEERTVRGGHVYMLMGMYVCTCNLPCLNRIEGSLDKRVKLKTKTK